MKVRTKNIKIKNKLMFLCMIFFQKKLWKGIEVSRGVSVRDIQENKNYIVYKRIRVLHSKVYKYIKRNVSTTIQW